MLLQVAAKTMRLQLWVQMETLNDEGVQMAAGSFVELQVVAKMTLLHVPVKTMRPELAAKTTGPQVVVKMMQLQHFAKMRQAQNGLCNMFSELLLREKGLAPSRKNCRSRSVAP